MLFHWIRIVKSVRPPFSDSKIVGSSFSGVFVYFQTFFCASCSSELILWWRRVELIGKQRSRGQDRKFSCGTFLGSCWKLKVLINVIELLAALTYTCSVGPIARLTTGPTSWLTSRLNPWPTQIPTPWPTLRPTLWPTPWHWSHDNPFTDPMSDTRTCL